MFDTPCTSDKFSIGQILKGPLLYPLLHPSPSVPHHPLRAAAYGRASLKIDAVPAGTSFVFFFLRLLLSFPFPFPPPLSLFLSSSHLLDFGTGRDHPPAFIGSPFLLLVNRKRTYTRQGWLDTRTVADVNYSAISVRPPFRRSVTTIFGRHDWNSNACKIYFLFLFWPGTTHTTLLLVCVLILAG